MSDHSSWQVAFGKGASRDGAPILKNLGHIARRVFGLNDRASFALESCHIGGEYLKDCELFINEAV